MAHPSRLLILQALSSGERCVCVLRELVGSDMSTVSKHLSLLKASGLVVGRNQGLWVYYHLRLPCILQFMTCLAAVTDRGSMPTCRCKLSQHTACNSVKQS